MSLRAVLQMSILTIALFAGVGLGLYLSFDVWPVTCDSAAPQHLSPEAQCLWLAWAADAYQAGGDLDLAREQVTALGADGPGRLCLLASGACETCSPGQQEAGAALAVALGVSCGG